MDSILNTTKKLLGISPEYKQFDLDIIVAINTAIGILKQIGVDCGTFNVTSELETWSDYLGSKYVPDFIKTYIWYKTKLLFDPPQSGTIVEAYNNVLKELESRISYEYDSINEV